MSDLRNAEIRVAASMLGESTARELYGHAAVTFALNTTEGRSTTKLWNALRECAGRT